MGYFLVWILAAGSVEQTPRFVERITDREACVAVAARKNAPLWENPANDNDPKKRRLYFCVAPVYPT